MSMRILQNSTLKVDDFTILLEDPKTQFKTQMHFDTFTIQPCKEDWTPLFKEGETLNFANDQYQYKKIILENMNLLMTPYREENQPSSPNLSQKQIENK